MSCAKRQVTCMLVTPYGEKFVGTNSCMEPQETCPRLPGEDYTKCVTVCKQPGHAERMALTYAGEKARGAKAFIHGISHVCRECQEALFGAGVESFAVVEELPVLE